MSVWATLWLLLSIHIDGIQVEPQVGPGCVVSAGAAVARHAGVSIVDADLARQTRIFADGTSLFEVQRALEGAGAHTWVASLSETELARLLAAGAPVVITVELAGSGHAMVVVGFEGPLEAPTAWTLVDPRDAQEHTWPTSALQSARQPVARGAMVASDSEANLDALAKRATLDPVDLRARDARQRAHGWYRLAMEHDAPTAGQRTLLERALSFDPSHAGAVAALAKHQ